MPENPTETPDAKRVDEQRAHFDKMWSSYWLAPHDMGPLTFCRYRLTRRELNGRIGPNTRFIDVGCGNGTFMATLVDIIGIKNMVGVEFSPQAAVAASDELRPIIQVGSITDLADDLSKNPFDVAVCSEVLEHVDDPKAILLAINKVLKKDGILVVTVPARMKYWSKQDEVAGHQRRFEYDAFEALAIECGYAVENHFGWGGSVARVYNVLMSAAGPERVMKNGANPIFTILSPIVGAVLRMEDSYRTKNGIQMITRLRKL